MGRGPRASRGSVVDFSDVGTCSGSVLDTTVPAPPRLSKYPSAISWAYAFKTGIRETPSSAASVRVDGTRSFGRKVRSTTAVR